ncbi:hypothetical protein F4861DRAFT_183268 [Xylaria intraflava]|nr:hypothetical protein F4861DRAFT_183268 [Xylaria intraflava]
MLTMPAISFPQVSSHSSTDYEAIDSSPNAPIAQQNGVTDGYFAPRESRSHSRPGSQSQTRHERDDSVLTPDDENSHSKWIHRDKLAKIENEELQAAGITLPKARTQSRSRRDRSHSRRRGTADSSEQQHAPKPRKNPDLSHDKTPELEPSNWDLRLPEEIAEDPGEYWVSNGSGKGTRIPVAKVSPAPIPSDYIDRNAPVQRKSSGSKSSGSILEEDGTSYSKSRSRSNSSANALDDSPPKTQPGKRSVTDGSPKKTPTTASRKTSAPAKTAAQGRPKTRSGTTPRSGSTTRPPTRSGELSIKTPEGDPPWMISAYQPDPRLPPDQQLLPTVARRLQQEKWEQEGALGSVFDKEFRPLNTGTFATPPESEKRRETEETQNEWPLKPEAAASAPDPPEVRAPTPSRPGAKSYSTMPKIHDVPGGGSRPAQLQTSAAVRVPDPPSQDQEKSSKAGCGCCVVM